MIITLILAGWIGGALAAGAYMLGFGGGALATFGVFVLFGNLSVGAAALAMWYSKPRHDGVQADLADAGIGGHGPRLRLLGPW